MIALFALFALVVQAFAPVAASAAQIGPGGTQLICTSHGSQTAPSDPSAPAGDCQHCVCPPLTDRPPPTPVAQRIGYAAHLTDRLVHADHRRPPARAPPRPPGQGPPTHRT